MEQLDPLQPTGQAQTPGLEQIVLFVQFIVHIAGKEKQIILLKTSAKDVLRVLQSVPVQFPVQMQVPVLAHVPLFSQVFEQVDKVSIFPEYK